MHIAALKAVVSASQRCVLLIVGLLSVAVLSWPATVFAETDTAKRVHTDTHSFEKSELVPTGAVKATVHSWKKYEFAFWSEKKPVAGEREQYWIQIQQVESPTRARRVTLAQVWGQLIPKGKKAAKKEKIALTFLERVRGRYLGIVRTPTPGDYIMEISVDDHGVTHTMQFPVKIDPHTP